MVSPEAGPWHRSKSLRPPSPSPPSLIDKKRPLDLCIGGRFGARAYKRKTIGVVEQVVYCYRRSQRIESKYQAYTPAVRSQRNSKQDGYRFILNAETERGQRVKGSFVLEFLQLDSGKADQEVGNELEGVCNYFRELYAIADCYCYFIFATVPDHSPITASSQP